MRILEEEVVEVENVAGETELSSELRMRILEEEEVVEVGDVAGETELS